MRNPVGKTIQELWEQGWGRFSQVGVFVLKDEDDDTGKRLDEAFGLRSILNAYPYIADYEVKFHNVYCGEQIIRCIERKDKRS